MSYWKGLAQAFKDVDDKRTKEKLIQDQREYDSTVREEDRVFQREMLQERMAQQRASAASDFERQKALLDYKSDISRKETFIGRFGSSVSRSGGGGGSKEDAPNPTVTLRAIATEYPKLDSNLIASVAGNPEVLSKIYSTLEKKKAEYADAGHAFTPDIQNNFLSDIIDTSRDVESVSDEEISMVADRYGVSVDEPVYEGAEQTFGDIIAADLAKGEQMAVFDESAAPEPISPEDADRYHDTLVTRITGYLKDEMRLIESGMHVGSVEHRQENRTKLLAIKDLLLSVENDGFIDPVLNTTYGTKVLMEIKNRDNRFDVNKYYPNFRPVFTNEEDIQRALEMGFINYNDTIIFNNKPFKLDK